jgi:hypothetical protein
MNSRSEQILTLYFNSWWLPTVFFLAYLAFLTILTTSQWDIQGAIGILLLLCLGIAYLGILSASVCNFIKKRWAKAVVNLVMLPVCALVFYYACLFLAALEGLDI